MLGLKGYVQTPEKVVSHMVAKLFKDKPPRANDRVLDAGCGKGEFIDGIIRWCKRHNSPVPQIVGVESDEELALSSKRRFADNAQVSIRKDDFLTTPDDKYRYIISNPPYFSILEISEDEKAVYKSIFATAVGRFDLYLLFFEKSLELLEEDGRLVFITPEKYVYVETAEPLRIMLARMQVSEIEFLDENTFNGLVTYPTITVVENVTPSKDTLITHRNGIMSCVQLPKRGVSWLSALNGEKTVALGHTLADICTRISCGVATGADEIFVKETETLPEGIRKFGYSTISGRELTHQRRVVHSRFSMLVPYSQEGKLLPFEELSEFGNYLSQPQIIKRLKQRVCCKDRKDREPRKPWYAFHENPPMHDILLPKILCKDIAAKPDFWVDKEGFIIPRHSVYYIVPKNADKLEELFEFLKSDFARVWLMKNSQRATNNFIRLQSHILKKLPIPDMLYSCQGNNNPDMIQNA